MSQTTTTWIPGSGFFETPAAWSGGTVPGANNVAVIDGSSVSPLTVTFGSTLDTNDTVAALSLFDATLVIAGTPGPGTGTLTIGAIFTGNDGLSSPLSELAINSGKLFVQQASTIGSFGNTQVVGLTQTGGTLEFLNGNLSSATSVLEGGQAAVNQSAGVIDVNTGTLQIEGNSSFAGELAGSTIELIGGAFYNFNAGVVLEASEIELLGNGTTLQLNLSTLDTEMFLAGNSTNIQLVGNTLTLDQAALGGTISTSGTVLNLGSIDDSGLTLQNAVVFTNKATVNQNAAVVIGNSVNSAATLSNLATYNLDVSGAPAVSGTGLFVNAGTFITSPTLSAASFSAITAEFNNTGTVVASSGTLDFANNDNFAGTIRGPGMVELSGGGSFTLDAGVLLSSSYFYVSAANSNGQLDLDVLGTLIYTGVFLQDAGTTIDLQPGMVGKTAQAAELLLTNAAQLSGQLGGTFIGGYGAALRLASTGTSAPISDNGLIVRGGMTVQDVGNVSQEGTVVVGLLSGDTPTLEIGGGALYQLKTPSVITGVGTITNNGTFEQGPVNGLSDVSAYFASNETVSSKGVVSSSANVICQSGTLEFSGADVFAGTISGAGTVLLSGAAFTLAPNLSAPVGTLEVSSISGAAQVTFLGPLTYNGYFAQTAGTTLALNGTSSLTLTGTSQLNGTVTGTALLLLTSTARSSDGGLVLTGSVAFVDEGFVGQQGFVTDGLLAGDSNVMEVTAKATYDLTAVSVIQGDGFIANLGTFEQSVGVTGTSVIGTEFSSAVVSNGTAIVSEPTVLSNGGDLEFTGSDQFAGTIGGLGTVALSAASFSFAAGIDVTVSTLLLTDVVNFAQLTIQSVGTQDTFTYAQNFIETGGATLSLAGNTTVAGDFTTVDLTGADDIVNGTIAGVGGFHPSFVNWSGANETDSGMSLTGNLTLTDSGYVGQGGTDTIGVQAGDHTELRIASGAIYNLSQQSSIEGVGYIDNFGTFEQGVSVTQTSTVSVSFTSEIGATVVVDTGFLVFTGTDIFAGTIFGNGIIGNGEPITTGVLEIGGDSTFEPGILVTVQTLQVVGGGDLTMLGNTSFEDLVYSYLFELNPGTTLTLAPKFTLTLGDAADSLNGLINGGGTIDWLANAQGSDAGATLSGSVTLVDTGYIGQSGTVTIGLNPNDKSELIVENGAAYNFRAQSLLTGNGSVVVDSGALFGQGTGASISNLVNVALFTSAGTVYCGTGGVIEFSGSDTFGGSIAGGGEIQLSGGTFTFSQGLSVSVSDLDIASNIGVAVVSILGSVSCTGQFTEVAGSTISFGPSASLTLSNGADVINGTIAGQGSVTAKTIPSLVFGPSTSSSDDGMAVTGAIAVEVANGALVGQTFGVSIGVQSGDTASSLRILAGGTYDLHNSATIFGNGVMSNAGTLLKDATFNATSEIAPVFTNVSGGNVTASDGMLQFAATVQNGGTVSAITGGTIEFVGAVNGTGAIHDASNGVLIFEEASAAAQTITFADNEGHVIIDDAGAFNSTFKGFTGTFGQSDGIDLVNVSHAGLIETYTGTTSSGVLTLTGTVDGQAATVAKLHFLGDYTLASFSFGADSSGNGTLITDPPSSTKLTSANTNTSAVEFTNSGTSTETAVLQPAGHGIQQVLGFLLNGRDVLDLQSVLAGAAGDPTLADIGSYITASDSGGNTTLACDPTGHGHGSAFATLDGVTTTLSGLLAHHALSLG